MRAEADRIGRNAELWRIDGEVRPLLPQLDVLMPRWVKALDAPPAQSSAPLSNARARARRQNHSENLATPAGHYPI